MKNSFSRDLSKLDIGNLVIHSIFVDGVISATLENLCCFLIIPSLTLFAAIILNRETFTFLLLYFYPQISCAVSEMGNFSYALAYENNYSHFNEISMAFNPRFHKCRSIYARLHFIFLSLGYPRSLLATTKLIGQLSRSDSNAKWFETCSNGLILFLLNQMNILIFSIFAKF